MSDSDQSKNAVTSRDQQKGLQQQSNPSLRLVQANGKAEKARVTSGVADSSARKKLDIDGTEILRFHESERLLHWAIAIPFVTCWVTALILLLVYNPDPSRSYRSIFVVIHRISGVCLFLLPLLAMLTKLRDYKVHLYNIKNAWRWTLDDVRWLFLMGVAAINKKIVLPLQGKFNAAEKVNFILVMVGWPLFAITGIMMWTQNTPWLPWLVHVTVAFLVTPAMLGHIYMATINPETRTGISGMITGYVNRRWAKHHYALWYQEQVVTSESQKIKYQDSTGAQPTDSGPDAKASTGGKE